MKAGGQTEKRGPVVVHDPGSHDALVDRVASSAFFQKLNRLRELLTFLCSRALMDPGAVIREQEIGVEVFGRRPGYDTSQDTIVRVHVSQLRKKLQRYFETEGLDEIVLIEIPKGAYTPVFTPRPPEPAGDASPEPRRQINRLTVLFACLAAIGLGLAVLSAFRRTPALSGEARPTVDRLWLQMFANGRRTCVVLSDTNLALFEDAIKHQLTLREYRNKEFAGLADELLKDPKERTQARMLLTWFVTHVSDAHLAAMFSVLNAGRQVPTDVVFARDFGVGYLQSHNVILLGSRRTNPWVELFEGQLNFKSASRENPAVAYFDNLSPLPGESVAYPVDWGRRGYCRLAHLPTPARNGTILLISGTDMASTEAGGQFISSERWVQKLRTRLGLGEKAPFPYFEVLLKVDYVAQNTPDFDIVAHRLPKL